MITITPALLQAATGCTAAHAELYAEHLDAACRHYGISATPERLAAFLAQLGHESGGLRHVRELADGRAYEGRRDLGNTEPGDGPLYRGRGLIQTTGRFNYRAVAKSLAPMDAPDFEAFPGALEEPRWAVWSAADYWDSRDLNALADAGQYEAITRRINGGLNGQADRLARWERAQRALAATPQAEGRTTTSTAPAPEAPKKETSMPLAPIVGAILPSIIEAIPKLGKLFGSGSQVSERNVQAASMAVDLVQQAVGAVNAQDAAERIKADPAALQAATQAIEAHWYELAEAGGGGIAGARKFAREAGADTPQVWRIVGVVTYCALAFLLLANVIAMAAWGVAMWRSSGAESATQILVQVIAADILSATSAISFWLGSSFGSRRKDDAAPRE